MNFILFLAPATMCAAERKHLSNFGRGTPEKQIYQVWLKSIRSNGENISFQVFFFFFVLFFFVVFLFFVFLLLFFFFFFFFFFFVFLLLFFFCFFFFNF